MTDKTGADVPQEQKAGWASFIKSLAGMTSDLSSMTAPPCEWLIFRNVRILTPSHPLPRLSYRVPSLLV